MKAFALFLVGSFLVVGLLAQTAVVVATHPWLAVKWFTSSPTVRVEGAPAGGIVNGPPGAAPEGVPADQWSMIVQAAQESACGVNAADLAAIASIESGFGTNMATSSAGAIGYGQFLPSTWAAYGQGGDPYDYHAALPAMARYLCAIGYGSNRTRALNDYGGCTIADCLGPGRGTYAALVSQNAASFAAVATTAAALSARR